MTTMEHKKMDSDSSHPSGDDSVARSGCEVPSLHAAIMNLQCKYPDTFLQGDDWTLYAFKSGHKEARHAAAELAAAQESVLADLLEALRLIASFNAYEPAGPAAATARAAIARAQGATA